MKKSILLFVITMYSFANSYAQEKLKINTTESELKWSCDYAFYFGGHYGNVQFKEGYFIKNNNKIIGGEFIIDLISITNTDIENAEGNASLVDHLKNEDFFDVEKFPTAKLVITSTQYHDETHLQATANLTIKGITLPIKFQAEVNFEKRQLNTKFKIDRTLWNITYKSKGAMSELKDGAISDAIGFEVTLSL